RQLDAGAAAGHTDAERPGLGSHAGAWEQSAMAGELVEGSHALRGNPGGDALRQLDAGAAAGYTDAERPGLGFHAGAWEPSAMSLRSDGFCRAAFARHCCPRSSRSPA